MPSKKTGIYISAINEPIINAIMEKHGYTKISNAINFVLQEYSRLIKEKEQKQDKQEIVEVKEEVKPKADFSGWFIAEDKNA